jgi:hypothetical protein
VYVQYVHTYASYDSMYDVKCKECVYLYNDSMYVFTWTATYSLYYEYNNAGKILYDITLQTVIQYHYMHNITYMSVYQYEDTWI